LAISSPARFANIPSLKEQKIDVDLSNWRGIFGAPDITTQQRDALVKLVRDATETPVWKETCAKFGWSPIFLGGDAYKKFVDEESKRVGAIIDSLGIK
jgi:putative tricarboxylic transport membrane protein